MTREEAKEILTHNWTRVDNPNYSESELDEAFFMAKEALQADANQVTSKLISVEISTDKGDKSTMSQPNGKLESADAVHGEWTAEIGYEGEVLYYECSNCKEAFSLLEGTPEENKYHYCPNCGARMENNNDSD